jgi:hypothetical protein
MLIQVNKCAQYIVVGISLGAFLAIKDPHHDHIEQGSNDTNPLPQLRTVATTTSTIIAATTTSASSS